MKLRRLFRKVPIPPRPPRRSLRERMLDDREREELKARLRVVDSEVDAILTGRGGK